MAKCFSETRDELSTTCNPKVMSRILSAPDATSLHHCLQNDRQYFTILSLIQALDTKRLVERGFFAPFYTAIVHQISEIAHKNFCCSQLLC